MSDNLTKAQRSKCMSRIRSKWTLQEKKIHNCLKALKVRHKMHPRIAGSLDIALTESRTAVFLHGCFWHKCPLCYKEPKSNLKYWLPKIERNVKRNRANVKALKKEGWKVLKIWEHEVKKDFGSALKKILRSDLRKRKCPKN